MSPVKDGGIQDKAGLIPTNRVSRGNAETMAVMVKLAFETDQ